MEEERERERERQTDREGERGERGEGGRKSVSIADAFQLPRDSSSIPGIMSA